MTNSIHALIAVSILLIGIILSVVPPASSAPKHPEWIEILYAGWNTSKLMSWDNVQGSKWNNAGAYGSDRRK